MVIVFDLNGVFFNHGTGLAVQTLATMLGIDAETLAFVLKGEFSKQYRAGALEPSSYWRKAGEFLKISEDQMQIVRRVLFDSSSPVDEVVEIVETLRGSGFSAAYASNMAQDRALYLHDKFTFKNFFDYGMCSWQAGTLKPDPRFFQKFLDRFHLQPREIAYIDDKAENTASARALGMTAFTFETPQDLRADLAAADLL